MPPEQPATIPSHTPNTQSTGQYDFIVNASNRGSSGFFSANTPLKTRIIIVAAGGCLLLLVVIIFTAILSQTGSVNSTDLINVAQRQAELARISQTPSTSASEQSTQDFAETTMLSMLSEQQSVTNFLAQNGTQISTQVLQARQNLQTDATLNSAQTSGTYDQTYISIAEQELASYAQALKQAYQSSSTTMERGILQSAYNQAQLLIAQGNQAGQS